MNVLRAAASLFKVLGILACLVTMAWARVAWSQADLPPAVQADLLRNQILDAVKGNQLASVLSAIDQYKKLHVEFPLNLLLVEAKAAHALQDHVRAYDALKACLSSAAKGSREYQEAIALYPEYEAAAKPLLEKRSNDYRQKVETENAAQRERWAKNLINDIDDSLQTIPSQRLQIGQSSSLEYFDTSDFGTSHEKQSYGGYWSPRHEVTLRGFRVLPNLVTRWEFLQYLRATRQPEVDGEEGERWTLRSGDYEWAKFLADQSDHVISVQLTDALDFVSWLAEKTGRKFRLMSETEWELFAQRELDDIGRNKPSLVRVGLGYGVLSMPSKKSPAAVMGATGEWMADCWHANYVGAPVDGSAWADDKECSEHVVRGEASAYRDTRELAISGRWKAGGSHGDSGPDKNLFRVVEVEPARETTR